MEGLGGLLVDVDQYVRERAGRAVRPPPSDTKSEPGGHRESPGGHRESQGGQQEAPSKQGEQPEEHGKLLLEVYSGGTFKKSMNYYSFRETDRRLSREVRVN